VGKPTSDDDIANDVKYKKGERVKLKKLLKEKLSGEAGTTK
jgi:hypothetical protein